MTPTVPYISWEEWLVVRYKFTCSKF